MARRTNYAFERNARAKAKAAKREAKRQAKLAAKAEKTDGMSAEEVRDDSAPQSQGPEDGHEDLQDGDVPAGTPKP